MGKSVIFHVDYFIAQKRDELMADKTMTCHFQAAKKCLSGPNQVKTAPEVYKSTASLLEMPYFCSAVNASLYVCLRMEVVFLSHLTSNFAAWELWARSLTFS